jgi:hypothetical protein
MLPVCTCQSDGGSALHWPNLKLPADTCGTLCIGAACALCMSLAWKHMVGRATQRKPFAANGIACCTSFWRLSTLELSQEQLRIVPCTASSICGLVPLDDTCTRQWYCVMHVADRCADMSVRWWCESFRRAMVCDTCYGLQPCNGWLLSDGTTCCCFVMEHSVHLLWPSCQ